MPRQLRSKVFTLNGKLDQYSKVLADHYSSYFDRSILDVGDRDQKNESIHYRVLYMSSNNIDIGYTLNRSLGLNKKQIQERQQKFIHHTLSDLSFNVRQFDDFINAYFDIIKKTGFCTNHNQHAIDFQKLFKTGVDTEKYYCNFSMSNRLFSTRFKNFVNPLSRTLDVYSCVSIKKHLIDGVLKTGLCIDLPIDFCKRKKSFSIIFGDELSFIHTKKGYEYTYNQDQVLNIIKEHFDKVGARVIGRHFKLSIEDVLALSSSDRLRYLNLIEMASC